MNNAGTQVPFELVTSRDADAGTTASRFSTSVLNARAFVLTVGLMVLAACSDSPMSPDVSIDRVAAARVMPSVNDARVRVAPGLQNTAIRDRVTHDLGELELSLANGDGGRARFHVRVLGTLIADYRAQQNWTTDGAEVTAISLVLYQVDQVIAAGYVLPVPR